VGSTISSNVEEWEEQSGPIGGKKKDSVGTIYCYVRRGYEKIRSCAKAFGEKKGKTLLRGECRSSRNGKSCMGRRGGRDVVLCARVEQKKGVALKKKDQTGAGKEPGPSFWTGKKKWPEKGRSI